MPCVLVFHDGKTCQVKCKATLMLKMGGFCGRRSARVELSTKVLDTPVKLRRTLLHELCHVAAWLLPPHVVCPASPRSPYVPAWHTGPSKCA